MIPYSTTTVTVQAVTEPEPGEGRTATVRAAAVRAVVSDPSGRDIPAPGGGREVVHKVLNSDPVSGMDRTDRVVDDTTGDTYEVVWVDQRYEAGMAHTRAGLRRTTGVAA